MPRRRKELLVNFEENLSPQPDALQQVEQQQVEQQGPVVEATKKIRSTRKKVVTPETESLTAVESLTEAETPAKADVKVHEADSTVESSVESREVLPMPNLNSKLNKKTRNETYTKERFFVRNDLNERLKTLVKSKSKGYKTGLINYALEKTLDELEKV